MASIKATRDTAQVKLVLILSEQVFYSLRATMVNVNRDNKEFIKA